MNNELTQLLNELATATTERKRAIRARLRRLGHRGGLRAADPGLASQIAHAPLNDDATTHPRPSDLSVKAFLFLVELVEDAGNWGGQTMIGGNVRMTPARKGYLTDLKLKGYLATNESEGCSFVTFYEKAAVLFPDHRQSMEIISGHPNT